MILSLILLGAIVAAFILMVITLKDTKKKDSALTELQLFAAENGSRITLSDKWNDSAIGIDEHLKMVYFINKKHGHEVKKSINLLPVRSCRLVQITRSAGEGKNLQTLTDRVEIALGYHDRSKPENFIEFYNIQYDKAFIVSELDLANKWVDIISKSLSSK